MLQYNIVYSTLSHIIPHVMMQYGGGQVFLDEIDSIMSQRVSGGQVACTPPPPPPPPPAVAVARTCVVPRAPLR